MNNPYQPNQYNIQFSVNNQAPIKNKTKTTITKKNPQIKKKSLKNVSQNKQPPKNPVLNNINLNRPQITNKNIYKTDIKLNQNLWLNKYFIYRHESLNNYLFNENFKKTLDHLSENYRKQVTNYHLNKPAFSPTNDLNNLKSSSMNGNNISLNVKLIYGDKTPKLHKTFVVTGGYRDVVNGLLKRKWVREPNAKSLDFDYIWTLKTNEINFMQIKNFQMANHYLRNGQITRKSGLSKNIKNLYYLGIDPMNFFPRCYDLSVKTELEDFKQDFKFTWAISLLILFQKEYKELGSSSTKSKKFSEEAIKTSINIINKNLFLLEKGGVLKDPDNIRRMNKMYLIDDQEWNLIYLPELIKNSNVQDIIYEVNSNKPGGANNPIKQNSKTVPKKIVGKPNETKKMLINMQGPGSFETNKFSNDFQSYSGLKNKVNQMKQEENKNNAIQINNININSNNTNNIIQKKIIKTNSQTRASNIPYDNNKIKYPKILTEPASFSENIPHVNSILDCLKNNLPQYKLNGFRNIWILKPSNLSRGRGVTCVNSLEPIEQSLLGTNDSGVIVQKYIENPLIIYKRKFDIRQWVLVTSLDPLIIWMWKEPYIRFGAEDYSIDDINNIYSHLTNNSIAKHSLQYKNEKKLEGDMWTCYDFENHIGKEKWKEVHEKIKNAIICSFYAIHQEIKNRINSHELYGYDFMIDEDYNVYLIEVNASPALDYSTKITEMLVKDMIKDLLEIVIDNDNGRRFKFGQNNTNKFVQIFNETKDKFIYQNYIPNKNIFY